MGALKKSSKNQELSKIRNFKLTKFQKVQTIW